MGSLLLLQVTFTNFVLITYFYIEFCFHEISDESDFQEIGLLQHLPVHNRCASSLERFNH